MTTTLDIRGALRVVLVMLALIITMASNAHAQQSPEYDTDDLAARGLFEEGRAAFDDGNYNDALRLFQQAYDQSQRPRLLYNIGQSADRLRMNRTALNAFRKYLELVPDAENRREVENRIRALEMFVVEDEAAQQAAPAATPTPLPMTRAPEPAQPTRTVSVVAPTSVTETSTSSNVAPWLVVGGGAVVTVAGAVLFGIGQARINNVQDAAPRSSWSSVRDDAAAGPGYRDAGIVTCTLGALAIVAGVTWLILGNDDSDAVTARIGPSGLQLRGAL